MTIAWLEFAAVAAAIWFAGLRVSVYGDLIAEKTGASRTWIGVVLMASVTSLPELFTGISSVRFAHTPDIAIGDILGSCVFNLLILTIVDVVHGHTFVFTKASRGHVLTAGWGVILIGTVGFSLVMATLGYDMRVAHFSLASLVIVGLYVFAMRGVFRFESEQNAGHAGEAGAAASGLTMRQVVIRYTGWALIVVAAAVWLPFTGDRIATAMGWGHSFVGNLFVAFATSLPEIVVTIGCVRQGAFDLAIGNVLGSNLFNILILAIDDFMYTEGPLFAAVAPVNAVSTLTALMMTGIAVVGLLHRPRTRLLRRFGWISITLIALYLLNVTVLYVHQQ